MAKSAGASPARERMPRNTASPATERKMRVYQIGEKVVCGSKGVCNIEEITTLNIPGVDKTREYYILKPLYMAASTVYLPVDTAQDTMRRVLTREEAEQLILKIPQISLIKITNDKLLEQEYKNCLRTDNCEEWIRIIKTIYTRRQKRIESGRKVTALDARYYRIAQDCLYGEFAVALELKREEVEDYIAEVLDRDICV